MHKKVNVSIKKRKNRKYLQARYRTSSGEWIERSTQTTNRKEATAIGYEWAKAEMIHGSVDTLPHKGHKRMFLINARRSLLAQGCLLYTSPSPRD